MICPFQTLVVSGIRPSGPQWMGMSPALVTACLGFCLFLDNEPDLQDEVNEEARNGKLKP